MQAAGAALLHSLLFFSTAHNQGREIHGKKMSIDIDDFRKRLVSSFTCWTLLLAGGL